MLLNRKHCTGCGRCVVICPVGAIHPHNRINKVRIDQTLCVECGTCLRDGACPEPGALFRPKLGWPRIVRSLFSDPATVHAGTGVPGRGTEEMKTNDVSGRLGPGQIGVSVDMGRPGISTTFADIQTIAGACARAGAHFEPRNPLTKLLADENRGKFASEVLKERVLSAIIEVEIDRSRLPVLLSSLKRAARKIDTVFSVGLCYLAERGHPSRALREEMKALGLKPLPNGKMNVGLGRPSFVHRSREKA